MDNRLNIVLAKSSIDTANEIFNFIISYYLNVNFFLENRNCFSRSKTGKYFSTFMELEVH